MLLKTFVCLLLCVTALALAAYPAVEIQNADFGIDLNSTNFCTVTNVTLTTSASRAVSDEARGANGHHGIDVSHGTENLVTHFAVQTKFVHDISVEWYALHTVFAMADRAARWSTRVPNRVATGNENAKITPVVSTDYADFTD